MVYGYKTNEKFIDASYRFLKKLEEKKLWNKDTLVIGLDKGVRPLVYTLRKLSKEECHETPDIKFFNYSARDDHSNIKKISYGLKKKINPKKLEKYNRILILDEHLQSGKSLEEGKEIIEKYLANSKNPPEINLAALGLFDWVRKSLKKENFIFLEDETVGVLLKKEKGVEDKKFEKKWWQLYKKKPWFQESIPLQDKNEYNQFVQDRNQLSKDIKEYLHEKNPKKDRKKQKILEGIVSGIFFFIFVGGLFLSSNNLTGNVIGTSGTAHRLLGILLILIGLVGFFVNSKLRK